MKEFIYIVSYEFYFNINFNSEKSLDSQKKFGDISLESNYENSIAISKTPAYACIIRDISKYPHLKVIHHIVEKNVEINKSIVTNKKQDENFDKNKILKEKKTYCKLSINKSVINNEGMAEYPKNINISQKKLKKEIKLHAAYCEIAQIKVGKNIIAQKEDIPRAAFINNTPHEKTKLDYSGMNYENKANETRDTTISTRSFNTKKGQGKTFADNHKAFESNSFKSRIILISAENKDLISKDYKFNIFPTKFSKSKGVDYQILIKSRSCETKRNDFNVAFLLKINRVKQDDYSSMNSKNKRKI